MTTNYDARMRRAKNLRETYPFAAEILTFYGRICAIQQQLAKELERKLPRGVVAHDPGSLREQLDVDRVLPFLNEALTELLPESPGPLAQYLKEYQRGSQERQGTCARTVRRGRWRECCALRATAASDFCCVRFAHRSGSFAEYIALIAARHANSLCRYLWRRNFRRFEWKRAIHAGTVFAAWT